MPRKSLDTLLLFILVIARVEIDSLADNVLPDRLADARNLVSGWWSAASLNRLDHPQTDPVTMMLWVGAFGLLAIYVLVAMGRAEKTHRLKLILLYGIIGFLVVGKTALLIGLRHESVPWSYSHDGGVIQTETTIEFFLQGKNPYVEDYTDTPMAEWGINEYRTALYHYPYLPVMFVGSAPFYALAHAALGWYDQRMLYLLAFILMLAMVQSLVKNPRDKLLAVMLVGLNPIMAEDVIFGVSDPYVFFWVILGLWLLKSKEKPLWASAAMGLAFAAKPTAWFLLPFWILYLLKDDWGEKLIPAFADWGILAKKALRQTWTLPALALLFILPYFVWNPDAMFDDVWRWSAGQGETGYQIWGWGASNLVLAFGWVENRFEYFSFIIPQIIVGVPLLLYLLNRQIKKNTLGAMMFGYGVFLFIFFYFSRFMQPNYLGFLGSVLTLAYFLDDEEPSLNPSLVHHPI